MRGDGAWLSRTGLMRERARGSGGLSHVAQKLTSNPLVTIHFLSGRFLSATRPALRRVFLSVCWRFTAAEVLIYRVQSAEKKLAKCRGKLPAEFRCVPGPSGRWP
jgi:hypothetical protein